MGALNRAEVRVWARSRGTTPTARAKTGKATPHPLAMPRDEHGTPRPEAISPFVDEVRQVLR